VAPDDQALMGVTPGLVRVSIGLEDGDEILADLERAIPR
jgi:cystathionine beta-lyase/cystathionine gamma-synthase